MTLRPTELAAGSAGCHERVLLLQDEHCDRSARQSSTSRGGTSTRRISGTWPWRLPWTAAGRSPRPFESARMAGSWTGVLKMVHPSQPTPPALCTSSGRRSSTRTTGRARGSSTAFPATADGRSRRVFDVDVGDDVRMPRIRRLRAPANAWRWCGMKSPRDRAAHPREVDRLAALRLSDSAPRFSQP